MHLDLHDDIVGEKSKDYKFPPDLQVEDSPLRRVLKAHFKAFKVTEDVTIYKDTESDEEESAA